MKFLMDVRYGSSTASRLLSGTVMLLFLAANRAMAAGGGKPATKLVNVADTRNLEPGLSKWIADLYNASHWQYGLLVVVLMAVMGLVLGYGSDQLMKLLGINLGKIRHHE
jgi:hypothetical protein